MMRHAFVPAALIVALGVAGCGTSEASRTGGGDTGGAASSGAERRLRTAG